MVKRIGSSIRKTRYKYKKSFREKGKLSLTSFFQKFDIGQRVCLKTNSAVQKGGFHPKFTGRVGIVKKQIGKCYAILIKDQNKEKTLQVHPVHLKKVQNGTNN